MCFLKGVSKCKEFQRYILYKELPDYSLGEVCAVHYTCVNGIGAIKVTHVVQ